MARNEFTCDCNVMNHEVVERTLAQMPAGDILDGVAEFWKVMGDPTRCRIIFALKQNEMCVCDLANVLSMTKSSISHQLSKMRSGGIVKCRRSGKAVRKANSGGITVFGRTFQNQHQRFIVDHLQLRLQCTITFDLMEQFLQFIFTAIFIAGQIQRQNAQQLPGKTHIVGLLHIG